VSALYRCDLFFGVIIIIIIIPFFFSLSLSGKEIRSKKGKGVGGGFVSGSGLEIIRDVPEIK
jgi:hypothetical protein